VINNSVKFVEGPYQDQIFSRGQGPTQRTTINGHLLLTNSTNFWYNGTQAISREYLESRRQEWVAV